MSEGLQKAVVTSHIHAETCAPKYVVTVDLPNKVETPFRRIGLKTPRKDDPFYLEFTDELVKRIQKAIPHGTDLRVINMEDLANDILAGATKMMSDGIMHKAFIISTCSEIANMDPGQGRVLSINRLVNFNGDEIGIGPRPGTQGLKRQIASIAEVAKNRPVIIIEDGSFTGGTLAHVVKLLKAERVNVDAIVLGFIFPDAREEIKKTFDGEIVTVLDFGEDIIDWMPDHDFTPGVHNCGRVVGIVHKTDSYPYYDHDGTHFGVPYLKPFTPLMQKWTNFSHSALDDISDYCIAQTRELFHLIAKLNNNQVVTVGTLKRCNPRIAIPYCVRDDEPYADDNQSIDDVLRIAQSRAYNL